MSGKTESTGHPLYEKPPAGPLLITTKSTSDNNGITTRKNLLYSQKITVIIV